MKTLKTKLLIVAWLALPFFGFVPSAVAQPAAAYIDAGGGSAFENAGAVIFTVARSGNANTVVTVDYITKDGTAKAGVDYTPVFGTLAFAAGETEKTISIPLADDDGLVDGDKFFRVSLTNATGGAVIETSEGFVTIQDNEVPANLDYSFNPVISSEYDAGFVSSLPTLPDGKLLIGGYFTRVNGVERSGLASLNSDGSLAAAFQTRLIYAGQSAFPERLMPLPDGRVYIAGSFDSVNGVDRPGLARLLPDGSLDPSFAPTNLNSSWEIAQTDGKIVSLTLNNGLVRLNLDGRRDSSFVPPFLPWDVETIAEHADGKLLVAGHDGPSYPLLRLNMDGSLDNSFSPVPLAGIDVRQILVQPDKKILVTGTSYSTSGVPFTNLERLNADGSLDTGFHVETGFETYGGWFCGINLADDGKIMVLGGYPPTARRLNPDGSLDNTFPGFHLAGHYGLSGYSASVKSIGGVVYIFGNFFSINGARASGLGRIFLDVPPRAGMDIQSDDTRGYIYSYLQVVGESDGLIKAKVRRLGQATGTAAVTWATRDGTAKAGKDYIATSVMLSFAPLEVEKIVTVPILDNTVFDGPRTLQLYLSNAVGADFIAPPLTMTILDDEVGFKPEGITRLEDGSVRMIVQVPLFQTLSLEVSSDLKNWMEATNVGQNYFSPFETEFFDSDAAQFPRRFYRVRAQ